VKNPFFITRTTSTCIFSSAAYTSRRGTSCGRRDQFREAIRVDPKALESYLYLSVIFAEEKKYGESIGILKELLRVDPNNLMGSYYLAKRYAEMKAYGEAELWYKKP